MNALARAFVAACKDELAAPKPGNVHVFASGHRMEAQDFIDSAEAAAGPLTAQGASVGARILGAVEATFARVKQNTNLGIVLLCAPLAHAALTYPGQSLNTSVARVLRRLDRDDAEMAFKAITIANPGGLGAAPRHDVTQPARATLLEAMREAAPRDRIARQYAADFEDVFGLGSARLHEARGLVPDPELATLRLYLGFLSAFPDSHIVRKFGAEAAERLVAEARAFAAAADFSCRDEAFGHALQFDATLKARGLNPGTSADLTVATLFADYVGAVLANGSKNG
ncbi:MAG TPA: triphosphoribosyl-dephospho-CoA synthase [Methylocystis sp.]|nr:triphosphoribosyl-dephospho-CoA synthase [Methylocystis sp.]